MPESGALLVGAVSKKRIRCPPKTKITRQQLKHAFPGTEGDILLLIRENLEPLLILIKEEIELLDNATYEVPEPKLISMQPPKLDQHQSQLHQPPQLKPKIEPQLKPKIEPPGTFSFQSDR